MNRTFTLVPLSLVAGLGTGLRGLIAVVRKADEREFALLMGVASGDF